MRWAEACGCLPAARSPALGPDGPTRGGLYCATRARSCLPLPCPVWTASRSRHLLARADLPAHAPRRAPSIYERQVRPVLEAAGCQLEMHLTKARHHATGS